MTFAIIIILLLLYFLTFNPWWLICLVVSLICMYLFNQDNDGRGT
jgi:hypothetical protein